MILLLLPPAKSTQKRGFGAPEQLRRLVRAVDLWLAPKYNSRHLREANRYQDKSELERRQTNAKFMADATETYLYAA